VYFTSATIVSSAVLFRGFGTSTPTVIATVVLGFLGKSSSLRLTTVICGGVILLQLAKSANKVSDATQLSSGLDDVKAIADVEKGEDDPGADAIRGALSIRRFSTVRRPSRSTAIDPNSAPIALEPRSGWRWTREHRKDGRFLNVPSTWGEQSLRESTIREVPPEEERKDSVQFDPTAPVTHIYPRRESPEKLAPNTEEYELERRGSHNPLSPVEPPGFLSAPPTPRYNTPRRPNVQKQFSFGRQGKKRLTQEETIGLVEAGRNEGHTSDEKESLHSVHSDEEEDSSDSERERERINFEAIAARRAGRPYGML
jgi:hypothetical protein